MLPFVTEMCNRSLQQGWLPISQRHAIVKPIIKKEGLDQDDVKNYWPSRKVTIRRQPIAAWYDDESRLLRRKSQTLEKVSIGGSRYVVPKLRCSFSKLHVNTISETLNRIRYRINSSKAE